MFHGVFTVKYITSKDCFCYLSDQNSKYFENGVTLKLSYGSDRTAYVSPQPLSGLNENDVGINRLQAQALGLYENDSIMVSVCSNVPGIRRLTVSPASQDDYEILELMAENLESTLLNQIRVVHENQKFVIWVTNSLHVAVNVDVAEPVTPGRLDNLTEVYIAQPKSQTVVEATGHSGVPAGWGFHKLFSYFSKSAPVNDVVSQDIARKFTDAHPPLTFSLRSVDDLLNCSESLQVQDFDVLVHREHLPKNFFAQRDSSLSIANLKVIIPPVVNNLFVEESNMTLRTIVVRLCILENKSCEVLDSSFPILYLHDCIFRHFELKVGSKGYLDNFISSVPSVSGIEISTTKDCTESAIDNFKSFINQNCLDKKLLLNADVVLRKPEFTFALKFSPPNATFCLIDSDFVRNCQFTVADSELVIAQPQSIDKNSTNDAFEDFGNFKKIVDDFVFMMKMGLINPTSKPENVMIVGKSGTGKSTIAKVLSTKLFNSPFYIHSETISCKNVKGKSLESLHRVFSSKLINLVYYQPSLLILDDLHVICEKVTEGDALTQETIHFNRVSEMVANLLHNVLSNNRITVLATGESVLRLNQHIFASRGLHLFKNVFVINELTKNDRLALLKFFFGQKCELAGADLEQFSQKTEGFVVQDLIDFANKAVFEALKEDFSERPNVTTIHCEVALQNTTALSLKDVQLHSPGDRDFSDIGGLDDVKKVLVECMMWPVQYPNLFANAPLRLQSGLLLYGPPGTGKTILAGAAAKHCGLRLISIKGPELLSKYIGASEQAVRNVFDKAQSAKPCILFFDEFDSLAPRRGHDSTGVTDRVVNQLLTQLDGIESLNGVCVLAATSRPDLLDPALLRPGRLDRQILCPLPNKEARCKILKSLSKKMTLASDVDLQKVAEKTGCFSGADLQAVLYTAQLSAVEESLDESKGASDAAVEINHNHLEDALNNTRPSLTKEENLKFKRIYSKFQQGSDLVDIKSGSQRATLA